MTQCANLKQQQEHENRNKRITTTTTTTTTRKKKKNEEAMQLHSHEIKPPLLHHHLHHSQACHSFIIQQCRIRNKELSVRRTIITSCCTMVVCVCVCVHMSAWYLRWGSYYSREWWWWCPYVLKHPKSVLDPWRTSPCNSAP